MPPEKYSSSNIDVECVEDKSPKLEILPPDKAKNPSFDSLDHGEWFTFDGRIYLKINTCSVYEFRNSKKATVITWNNKQVGVVRCELNSLRVKQVQESN